MTLLPTAAFSWYHGKGCAYAVYSSWLTMLFKFRSITHCLIIYSPCGTLYHILFMIAKAQGHNNTEYISQAPIIAFRVTLEWKIFDLLLREVTFHTSQWKEHHWLMATSRVRLGKKNKKKTNWEVGGELPMVALTILLSGSDLEIVFKQGWPEPLREK